MTNTSDVRRTQEDANKAFFRKAFEEFFIQHDLESVERNYSPNYIQHNQMVAAWGIYQLCDEYKYLESQLRMVRL